MSSTVDSHHDAAGRPLSAQRSAAVLVRTRGIHEQWSHTTEDGMTYRTTLANHSGDVPTGTLVAIERDMEPAFGRRWLRG